MQEQINKYFSKLCKEKFLENDDETIIGKVKDVIDYLEEQIKYASDKNNNIDNIQREFITSEAITLINEIKREYRNDEDVIKISLSVMSGFYSLIEEESLYKDLKEYYDELEEK